MTVLEIIVTIQLVVSLYLTHRVWRLQEEIEDMQTVIGAILMHQSDTDFNLKDIL
jgi:hypothetical protein